METEIGQSGAAYVAWRTFVGALERLAAGLPHRVDRSLFGSMAGSAQAQLITTLKFLDLIDSNNAPTESLKKLVQLKDADWKEALRVIFSKAFSDLIDLDLMKVTESQLRDEIGKRYGLSGATARKAQTFFLNGAVDLGIPIGPWIAKSRPTGNGSASRRRRTPRRPPAPAPSVTETSTSPATQAPAVGATAKSVPLVSGGVLTLSATLDLFALKPADRKFVFSLIDLLEEYEASTAAGLQREPDGDKEPP